MVLFCLLLSLSLLTVDSCASSSVDQSPLVLAVGTSLNFPAKNNASIWVSNGRVLKVDDLHSAIRLTGKKLGHCSVRVGSTTLQSYVVDTKTHRTWELLHSTTQPMWGPTLSFDGKRPVISGQIHRLQDWLKIAALPLPSSYNFEAQLDADLIPAAQLHFKQLLKDNNLPLPHFQWTPKLSCEIPAKTPAKTRSKQAQQLLASYGIHCQPSNSVFEVKPLVRTKIVFAEVSKQFQQHLGLNWQQNMQAQILPSTAAGGGLIAQLNTLEGKGHGQVLSSPSLVSRSGFEASFLAGGELPIQVGHFKSKSVSWKKYGVQLRVKPLVSSRGQIRLNIQAEISSVDMGRSIGEVPALKVNSFHTEIDLRQATTVVISGLLKTQGGLSSQQLPGLHKLPILGALFRSKQFLNDQSELVAFLTPSIVDPNNERAELPRSWKDKAAIREH